MPLNKKNVDVKLEVIMQSISKRLSMCNATVQQLTEINELNDFEYKVVYAIETPIKLLIYEHMKVQKEKRHFQLHTSNFIKPLLLGESINVYSVLIATLTICKGQSNEQIKQISLQEGTSRKRKLSSYDGINGILFN